MRDLTSRLPWELRAELEAAAATLVEYGPVVIEALQTLGKASTDVYFATAVPASLDPAELADVSDDEWDAFERATGIDRAYEILGMLNRVDGL